MEQLMRVLHDFVFENEVYSKREPKSKGPSEYKLVQAVHSKEQSRVANREAECESNDAEENTRPHAEEPSIFSRCPLVVIEEHEHRESHRHE